MPAACSLTLCRLLNTTQSIDVARTEFFFLSLFTAIDGCEDFVEVKCVVLHQEKKTQSKFPLPSAKPRRAGNISFSHLCCRRTSDISTLLSYTNHSTKYLKIWKIRQTLRRCQLIPVKIQRLPTKTRTKKTEMRTSTASAP